MKTDKELLELAARAYGIIDVEWRDDYTGDYYYDGNTWGLMYLPENGNWTVWNPLTDDGDALRLAVKLGLVIDIDYNGCVGAGSASFDEIVESVGSDPLAATRRAIVRAAAAIGEKL